MNISIGILAVVGVIGLLAIVAGYRFVAQRRQLSSGRNIGRFAPKKQDGQYIFEHPITVSAGGKWCRLLLTLQGADAHRIRYAPRYFFEKVALVIGTPFTLTLRDARHRVLHTETRSLEPFIAWLRSNHCGSETMLGERSRGCYAGSFALLEFLPKEPGQYFISLTIAENASAEHPGSSSTWQILGVELSAAEDVLPLAKTISYPHKRICL